MIPGKRINLWALEKGDLLQNYIWGNDPEIVKLTGLNPVPKTAWEIDRWYETIVSNPSLQVMAIKLNDNTYIGNVELNKIDFRSRSAEIGIMIGDRRHREKGFGKEALIMTARYAFEELGLHRLYADVLDYNAGGHKLFTSCGFKKEGVLRESFFTWGRFWNVTRYSILSKEFFERFPYQPEKEDESPKNGDQSA